MRILAVALLALPLPAQSVEYLGENACRIWYNQAQFQHYSEPLLGSKLTVGYYLPYDYSGQAFLVAGDQVAPWLHLGCQIWSTALVIQPISTAPNHSSLRLPIPDSAALIGFQIVLQVHLYDPANGNEDTSRGMLVTVGR